MVDPRRKEEVHQLQGSLAHVLNLIDFLSNSNWVDVPPTTVAAAEEAVTRLTYPKGVVLCARLSATVRSGKSTCTLALQLVPRSQLAVSAALPPPDAPVIAAATVIGDDNAWGVLLFAERKLRDELDRFITSLADVLDLLHSSV